MSETPPTAPTPPFESSDGAIGLPIHRPGENRPAVNHPGEKHEDGKRQGENWPGESGLQSGEVPVSPVEANTQLVTQVPSAPEVDRTVFMPPIDIYDSGDGLFLLADLPGVTIESLEIQVQDNRLTLYGRVTPVLPSKAQLLHQEFEWGDFLRSFILSDEVDHDRITAKLNNGVLEVFLPRTPKAEPRRIQVNRE